MRRAEGPLRAPRRSAREMDRVARLPVDREGVLHAVERRHAPALLDALRFTLVKGSGAPLAPEPGGVGSELRPQCHAISPSRCGSTVVAAGAVEMHCSLCDFPRTSL